MRDSIGIPFDHLSETGGMPVTDEAMSMVVTRYALAAELARGRRVLEVGVAGGMGNRMLGDGARFFVGGDVNDRLLRQAASAPGRPLLAKFDAQKLPFAKESFDLVVCMECLYYMPDPAAALSELTRVLAPRGEILIVNANPSRPDFIRSPHSHLYHAPHALAAQLADRGLQPGLWGGFPLAGTSESFTRRLRSLLLALARRTLDYCGLVPRSLEARARVKRLLYWRMSRLPRAVDYQTAPVGALAPLTPANEATFKVFYCIAGTRDAPPPRLPEIFSETRGPRWQHPADLPAAERDAGHRSG